MAGYRFRNNVNKLTNDVNKAIEHDALAFKH